MGNESRAGWLASCWEFAAPLVSHIDTAAALQRRYWRYSVLEITWGGGFHWRVACVCRWSGSLPLLGEGCAQCKIFVVMVAFVCHGMADGGLTLVLRIRRAASCTRPDGG